MRVTELNIYPLKSARGIPSPRALFRTRACPATVAPC